jgi:hypothetical protein
MVMAIFEFENGSNSTRTSADSRKTKEECIIALKVYDSCRQQDCLDGAKVGPARAARNITVGGQSYTAGEIINPPDNAAAVVMKNVNVCKAIVVSKEPSPFRLGYWDIDLKYVIDYNLEFKNVNGETIGTVPARSLFNKLVTLFGSMTTGSTISTDLLNGESNTLDLNTDPFVLIESKAVGLKSELRYTVGCDCNDTADAVIVTIGLFTIIKLYRLVNLTVESKGFCIPAECEDTGAESPCEYFDGLDFPMDVFAPPQKKEFEAGISGNIPATTSNTSDTGRRCGCGCGCGNRR